MTQLADAFSIALEDCMIANIEKLKRRYPDTFTDFIANNRDLDSERKALEGKIEVREDLEALSEKPPQSRPVPFGTPADEAFGFLFGPDTNKVSQPSKGIGWGESTKTGRTSSEQPNQSNIAHNKVRAAQVPPKPTGTGHAVAKAFEELVAADRKLKEAERPKTFKEIQDELTLMNVTIGIPETGHITLYPVNGAGFAEPEEVYDESIEYPLDSEGKPDRVGWTFGIPTLPGDYDWFSPIHSLDPRKITTHRGYNGNPGSWGRKVYWRKAGPEAYPGWTFAIPIEAGKYEWFYSYEPFNYRVSLIEVKNFSFTSVEVYFRKLNS